MSKKDMKKEGAVLRVRNLHIHLDEHMETTNYFGKEDAPCCCGCRDGVCGCQGEEVEIDLDELAVEIARETGIETGIVKKVLTAEESILEKMGVVEVVEEETTGDDPQEVGSAAQEEHTAEDGHTAQESRKQEGSTPDFLEKEFPEMLGQLLGGAILMGIMESVLPEGMRPGKKPETGGTGHGKDRK